MLAAELLGGGLAGEPRKRWRERRWGEAGPRGLWFERLERSDPWWPRGALQPQAAQALHWERASGADACSVSNLYPRAEVLPGTMGRKPGRRAPLRATSVLFPSRAVGLEVHSRTEPASLSPPGGWSAKSRPSSP